MWNFLRNVPIAGSVVRKTEILQAILAELKDTQSKLKEAERKLDSDSAEAVRSANLKALAAIGAAIISVVAAIGDPEPISKAALILTTTGSLTFAFYSINDAIDTLKKTAKQKERFSNEMEDLDRNKEKLEELLDELKKIN